MRWVLLLLIVAPASAAELNPSGRIFTDLYLPTRQPGRSELNQVSTSTWLTLEPKLGENASAHATLTADHFEASRPGTEGFRTGIREGFVSYSKGGVDFRVGKQIIPWGKSDGVNPTDFLTGKDYTFLNPDDEVRRVGTTGVMAGFTPSEGNSPWNLTAVWNPVFAKSKLLIAPSVIPEGVKLQDERDPERTVVNSELALKASYFGEGWDLSLVGYRGRSHMPEFASSVALSGVPVPIVSVELTPEYHRIHALGGDASYATGDWIVRAESAYIWTQNDDGTNPLIQPSHFDTVIGLERPFGDFWRVQWQFLWRYHPRFTEPGSGDREIAPGVPDPSLEVEKANALLLGYQEKSREGATLRVAYSNEESGWDVETFFIGHFRGEDFLVRPKVSYAWTDALRVTLGFDYHGGPKDRPLGALKPYNSLFFEGKYSF